MSLIKRAIAILFLTCFVLMPVAGLFSYGACALADFATYADRNTRPSEPVGYDVDGTAVHTVVAWNGTRGVGNLGIGNGDVALMKPDVIDRAVKNSAAGPGAPAGGPLDDSVPEEDDAAGWGFERSGTEGAAGEAGGPEVAEEAWESLLPRYVAAASVINRGEPYAITVNEPFPHILNENPVESGVLYAKLLGLSLPGGRMIDMGIKSLGTEF